MKARSWRTTLGGFMAAAGLFLVTDYDAAKENVWVKRIGQFLAIGGTAMVGAYARDNNISSEQAGAIKPNTSKP